MKTEILTSRKCINDIVDIHMRTFSGFFLTFLGKGFIKQLYQGFITHNDSNIIGAFDDDRLLGFVAYSENLSGFYKYLIKKSLIPFAFYSFLAFLRKPKIMFRLLRALTYPKSSKREEAYIEISSIGVLPEAKNQGVGTSIIDALKIKIDDNQFRYIKLETDKLNNDVVNAFYVKNGFELYGSFATNEGREMNEYRYYLKSEKLA